MKATLILVGMLALSACASQLFEPGRQRSTEGPPVLWNGCTAGYIAQCRNVRATRIKYPWHDSDVFELCQCVRQYTPLGR